MRKFTLITLALAATLAFGGFVATAATKKTYGTGLSIRYSSGSAIDPSDPFASAAFKGKVRSDKRQCKKKRTVVITERGGGKIGKTRSAQNGSYAVDTPGFGPGKYYAKAKKKTIKKKNKKIVCKAGKSPTITVPPLDT